MKKTLCATLALLFLLGSSCMKKKETPCDFDECGFSVRSSEVANIQAYLNAQGITNAVQHCSGAFYTVVHTGTGETPSPCASVRVAYGGYLTNGNNFDSSASASFRLQALIPAWPLLVPKIKEGGEIVMYVPPSLGYGSSANGPIPANSILIFRVKLYEVQ
ncbi:MAG: FKBP-type peptidylprolyl isomerase [Chitinophagaceae bacterium]|nr:MAG: FKBP-type peptidylprolyl isomerase [Chitinophagaceae bacterium]